MGLVNWLMKGIGFEGDEDSEQNDNKLAEQRKELKELKKQEKIAKKLEREQVRAEKKASLSKKAVEQTYKSVPSETVFSAPQDNSNNYSYNQDSYQMGGNSYGYDSNPYSQNSYGQTSMNIGGGYGNKNVIFFYPKSYSEVQKLIDYLRQGESVMLNLDGISDEEAQRMLDFASGAVYAISGSIQRVSGSIFLLTPEGLGIINDRNN